MGSYDPVLNLVYWGTGNPGPDWNPAQRPGDNLYTDSVVALDPDTGKLQWHFQFTPNDGYDYDSTQVPVLAYMDWNGKPRKLMLFASRNRLFLRPGPGLGQFLLGTPFVKVNWASGLDKNGSAAIPSAWQPAGMPVKKKKKKKKKARRREKRRAAPIGIRLLIVRAPDCFISRPGRITPPPISARKRCISPAVFLSAARPAGKLRRAPRCAHPGYRPARTDRLLDQRGRQRRDDRDGPAHRQARLELFSI